MADDKRKKVAAQTGLYLIVIVGIAVLANMISAGAYGRSDWTLEDRYTLSEGSGRLVRELKQPVRVDAYVKTGLAHLDAFVRDLTDLLQEYKFRSRGRITIVVGNSRRARQAKNARGGR